MNRNSYSQRTGLVLNLPSNMTVSRLHFRRSAPGIYGYPIQQAAPLAIQTVIEFIRETPEPLRLVRFCLFSDADLDVYSQALDKAKQP